MNTRCRSGPAESQIISDLVNALTISRGYLELVADDPELPPQLRNLLETAQVGLERVTKAVQHLQLLREVRSL